MYKNAAHSLRSIMVCLVYAAMIIVGVIFLISAIGAGCGSEITIATIKANGNTVGKVTSAGFNSLSFAGVLAMGAISELLIWMSSLFAVAMCDMMCDIRDIRNHFCGGTEYAENHSKRDQSSKTSDNGQTYTGEL